MAPDDTKMTSWPRLAMDATSAAKVSSQLRFRRPFSASTSNAEPTFTTTRLASDKRRAAVLRSVMVITAQYCHLLEQGASPNISLRRQINASQGQPQSGQRVRTDRRAVVRGLGERG